MARDATNRKKHTPAPEVTYFMRRTSRRQKSNGSWQNARTNESAPNRLAPPWRHLAALAMIAVVSRLPQLLTPNLLVDGDECVLGLMARHVAQGREFPIFFYGQDYGLSIVEAPIAAASFFMFGVGAIPLKLAMLAVW